MVLEKVIKKEKHPEEFLELDSSAFVEEGKVNVRIENLTDYADADRILSLMREGNVIFLKIKELRSKNITELKRCVDKLKKTCLAMEGDIVGVDEDFLVLTPNFAKIYRGKAA